MHDVPAQYKTIGVLQLVAGICNLMFGWVFGFVMWGTVGGLCTTIPSLGLCPIGMFCSAAGLLIVPLGVVELVVGIITLANPEAVRPFHRVLPLVQFPAILLGDFISPMLGGIAFMMTRDPEVAAYLEG